MRLLSRALFTIALLGVLAYGSYGFGRYVLSSHLFGPQNAALKKNVAERAVTRRKGSDVTGAARADIEVMPADSNDSGAAPPIESLEATRRAANAEPSATRQPTPIPEASIPIAGDNSSEGSANSDAIKAPSSDEQPRRRRRRRRPRVVSAPSASVDSSAEASSNDTPARDNSDSSATDTSSSPDEPSPGEPSPRRNRSRASDAGSNSDSNSDSGASNDNANSDGDASPAPRVETRRNDDASSGERPTTTRRRRRERRSTSPTPETAPRAATRVSPRSTTRATTRSAPARRQESPVPRPEGSDGGGDSPVPVPE